MKKIRLKLALAFFFSSTVLMAFPKPVFYPKGKSLKAILCHLASPNGFEQIVITDYDVDVAKKTAKAGYKHYSSGEWGKKSYNMAVTESENYLEFKSYAGEILLGISSQRYNSAQIIYHSELAHSYMAGGENHKGFCEFLSFFPTDLKPDDYFDENADLEEQ